MSELGPAIWITIPLIVIGLYGLIARRNLVRMMISLEIIGAGTVTILGSAAAASWNGMGEVLGVLALVALGIEGALLIAIATAMSYQYKTFDIYVFKKEVKEE